MNKIKILFLAANPGDTNNLALDEEIREIASKIRAADHRDSIDLISAWAVRPDDLLQLLNQHKPQIVHFSGHGSNSGEIILTDHNGVSKPVSSRAIKALFTTLKDNVRAVVLNACYSKEQAEAITQVIDCAVGMSDSIGDKAAITFAASFYRAIGFGRSIQEAFDQGITALLLEGIPEENTPDLLVRMGVDSNEISILKSGNGGIVPEQDEAIVGMIDVQSGPFGNRFEMPPAIPIEEIAKLVDRPESNRTQWSYKVVAFDLGGTLIRGGKSTYSWKLIWDYLNLDQELHRNCIAKYLRKRWSYNDWCNFCCELFIEKGLMRDDIEEIVKTLHLTINFKQTIKRLKRENFVIAIISGSIDTFLEIMVPEYKDIFDYVYLNRFIFDKNDRLIGVIPTDCDFSGKAQALEQICQKVGCTIKETVFVGEGLNDQDAIKISGLSIAYPPTDETIGILCRVRIKQDDLSLILPYILVDD